MSLSSSLRLTHPSGGSTSTGWTSDPCRPKRTAKRDVPTEECVEAVERVLASADDGQMISPTSAGPGLESMAKVPRSAGHAVNSEVC
jgi:hypothetical protein